MPTSFAFLPDGRMLVGEIGGTIRVLSPPYTQPDPTPLLTITNIAPTTTTGTNEGLMNIAVDPNFATNHYFYVDYTANNPFRTRLSRFTANALATRHGPGQRARPLPGPRHAGIDHHGGAILFRNDGTHPLHDRRRGLHAWRCAAADLPAGQGPPDQQGRHRPGDNPYSTAPDRTSTRSGRSA